MIHKFGFDFADPYFDFDGLRFAFRVCTFENVYGIDPESISVKKDDSRLAIEAKGLQFAGGQQRCSGSITANIRKEGEDLVFRVRAGTSHDIKGITILIRDLAAPVASDQEAIEAWPTPGLDTSAFPVIKTVDGSNAAIVPATTDVRFRRWAVYRDYSGCHVFNLSEDQAYTDRSGEMTGSQWRLIRNTGEGKASKVWYRMLEEERGLRPWDDRTDVPDWFRSISLVLNMHCEGWTGYVFNTFDRQLEILKWIAERMDGRHVLVYLPGWDGRYYWNYPLYLPSEACGGASGLRRMVEGAHALGMHVIPMFGVIASNYANTRTLGFQDAACRTPFDLQEICDWTEWDEDLSNEPVWQPLNVGEPKFRKHLLDRIAWTTDTFDTDGAMLDISGWMPRDPRHNLLEGLTELIESLHYRYDDYLVFGENGCDLHLNLFPLFQHAAHLAHDHPFHHYCRTAYHLYCGAPGKGSNGVFESGHSPFAPPKADIPAIPTLSVVQDTLPNHKDEVEAALDAVKAWGQRWH